MSNYFQAEVWPRTQTSRSIFQYIPYQRIGIATAFGDAVLIVAASVLAGVVYHSWAFETQGDLTSYVMVGVYSAIIFILLSKLLGLYQPDNLLVASAQLRGVVIAWGAVLMFVTSIFFLLKSGANYSRVATVGFGVTGLGFVLVYRAIVGHNLNQALSNGTLAGPRVIIIGDASELSAKSSLYLLQTYGMREVGRFELSTTSNQERTFVTNDIAITDAAMTAAQAANAEQIVLALRWVDIWRRDLVCERLRALPLPVLLLPDQSVGTVLSTTDSGRCSLTAIEVQRAPLRRHDLSIKRVFDLVLASLGLLLLSPLLLVTAIAIKCDSAGPVVFQQRRKGFNGREFAIYKFRTMSVLEDGPSIQQAQKNDERVTRLGRLLRSSSIDELPQLFNVIRGEMSLVGPRPHAIAHDDEYSGSVDNYAFRHHVQPGITGWAQIHGYRGETAEVSSMKERIQLDLWYINNWSLWLDFRIVARTCVELMHPRNAY
jgi:Undecaprenyl-phosphate glucose phosphotransferase